MYRLYWGGYVRDVCRRPLGRRRLDLVRLGVDA